MFIRIASRMVPEAPAGSAPEGQSGSNEGQAEGSGSKGAEGSAPGGQAEGNQEESRFDLGSLDPKTQKYIKDLRNEAAQYRTQSNQLKTQFDDLQGRIKSVFGGENQEAPVEEQLSFLQNTAQNLAMQNAVLQTAVANGIGADGLPYMNFLIQQATANLEEGEELEEEAMETIIQEVRAKSGAGRPAMGQTSVSAPRSPSSGQPEVSPEDFKKMGISEKTALYRKSPDLYEKLRKVTTQLDRNKR